MDKIARNEAIPGINEIDEACNARDEASEAYNVASGAARGTLAAALALQAAWVRYGEAVARNPMAAAYRWMEDCNSLLTSK